MGHMTIGSQFPFTWLIFSYKNKKKWHLMSWVFVLGGVDCACPMQSLYLRHCWGKPGRQLHPFLITTLPPPNPFLYDHRDFSSQCIYSTCGLYTVHVTKLSWCEITGHHRITSLQERGNAHIFLCHICLSLVIFFKLLWLVIHEWSYGLGWCSMYVKHDLCSYTSKFLFHYLWWFSYVHDV